MGYSLPRKEIKALTKRGLALRDAEFEKLMRWNFTARAYVQRRERNKRKREAQTIRTLKKEEET